MEGIQEGIVRVLKNVFVYVFFFKQALNFHYIIPSLSSALSLNLHYSHFISTSFPTIVTCKP